LDGSFLSIIHPFIGWFVPSFLQQFIHPSIYSFIFVLVVVLVVVVRCSSGEALRSNLCGKKLSRLPKSCLFVCVGDIIFFFC
jgi:hypothetical protein